MLEMLEKSKHSDIDKNDDEKPDLEKALRKAPKLFSAFRYNLPPQNEVSSIEKTFPSQLPVKKKGRIAKNISHREP